MSVKVLFQTLLAELILLSTVTYFPFIFLFSLCGSHLSICQCCFRCFFKNSVPGAVLHNINNTCMHTELGIPPSLALCLLLFLAVICQQVLYSEQNKQFQMRDSRVTQRCNEETLLSYRGTKVSPRPEEMKQHTRVFSVFCLSHFVFRYSKRHFLYTGRLLLTSLVCIVQLTLSELHLLGLK